MTIKRNFHGYININKDSGPTSSFIVSNVKRLIRDTLKMFGPVKYKDENGNMIDVERTFNTHGMDHYQSDIS